jgi:hypothetical protein
MNRESRLDFPIGDRGDNSSRGFVNARTADDIDKNVNPERILLGRFEDVKTC